MRTAFGGVHGWARRELVAHQPPDFEITVLDDDLDRRARISAIVAGGTDQVLAGLFARHRPIGRSILVKWPAPSTHEPTNGVPDVFHNDSTYVDERTGARTYMVWLALDDVTSRNGGVQVVPHSHRLDRAVRGWGIDAPWLQYHDLYAARATTISLRAGEALVWDPALIHRSGANTTDRPRVAASILLAEPTEPLCIFRRADDGAAERVELRATFFEDGRVEDLLEGPPAERLALEVPSRSPRDIARRLDRCAATRRWSRPFVPPA